MCLNRGQNKIESSQDNGPNFNYFFSVCLLYFWKINGYHQPLAVWSEFNVGWASVAQTWYTYLQAMFDLGQPGICMCRLRVYVCAVVTSGKALPSISYIIVIVTELVCQYHHITFDNYRWMNNSQWINIENETKKKLKWENKLAIYCFMEMMKFS